MSWEKLSDCEGWNEWRGRETKEKSLLSGVFSARLSFSPATALFAPDPLQVNVSGNACLFVFFAGVAAAGRSKRLRPVPYPLCWQSWRGGKKGEKIQKREKEASGRNVSRKTKSHAELAIPWLVMPGRRHMSLVDRVSKGFSFYMWVYRCARASTTWRIYLASYIVEIFP